MNDISQDEVLTRFIFDRKKGFSPGNRTVKFKAFMPPLVSKDPPLYSPDLSVYRISALSDSDEEFSDDKVWEIGREYVQTAGRTLKARANLSVDNVYQNNLEVVSAPYPHKRHANITPFPAARIACQRIATKLALASELVIIPPEDI